jgi:hypothetical protein
MNPRELLVKKQQGAPHISRFSEMWVGRPIRQQKLR